MASRRRRREVVSHVGPVTFSDDWLETYIPAAGDYVARLRVETSEALTVIVENWDADEFVEHFERSFSPGAPGPFDVPFSMGSGSDVRVRISEDSAVVSAVVSMECEIVQADEQFPTVGPRPGKKKAKKKKKKKKKVAKKKARRRG